MPQYKLYYFNGRGRAEPARLCFAAAGIKYEDVRFTGEEWQQKKKEGFSPLGYLPVLEVDGKKLNESMAIFRYAARESGLCPSDTFEVGQCDMVVDMTSDVVFTKMAKCFFEKDEETKKLYTEEFVNTHLPKFMTTATSVLKANNGGQGFFVGSKLSYADIIMFYAAEMELVKKVIDNYPEIKAHYQRICEIPNIKTWVETRPKTMV